MSLWRLSVCMLLSCLLLLPRVYADEAAVRDGWIDWARSELGGIEQRLDSLGDSVQVQRWLPGFKDILLPVRTEARDCAS